MSMEEEFNKKHFAIRLREIRKSKGLTQEEICDLTGMDVSNYSKIETGKIAPSLISLQKLIKYANFQPNELFEYSHLDEEEKLDQKIFESYKNFSLKQKRALYKFMRIVEELK